MDSILQQIIACKKTELAEEKRLLPLEKLREQIQTLPPTLDFAAMLGRKQINIIAELKMRSPSKGLIRPDFDAAALAPGLAAHGAAALSVLTETGFFGGSLDNLVKVRPVVSIPLLRKDFIFDHYQLYQARAASADAVLLIAAMLDGGEFTELANLAEELHLAVLAEAHNAREIEFLQNAGAKIIGVNARNLNTFATDLDEVKNLIRNIGHDRIIVAESAIRSRRDIDELRAAGAHAFLIGETLMRADDPGKKLQELIDGQS